MSGRTDRERARSDTALAMPPAAQAMLIKILARTAGAAFDSAMELVDDLEAGRPAEAAGVPATTGTPAGSEPEPAKCGCCLCVCENAADGPDGFCSACRATRTRARGVPPSQPYPPLSAVPDHTPEQDAADWQHGPAEEEHAARVTPLRPRGYEQAHTDMATMSDAEWEASDLVALIPCPPAAGGERTCDNWRGNFCCTGSALHGGLAHASHAENGDVIGVWPATPASGPQPSMGHLASLAGKLAQRATPGTGGTL